MAKPLRRITFTFHLDMPELAIVQASLCASHEENMKGDQC